MSTRIPPTPRSPLPTHQQESHDFFDKAQGAASGSTFIYKNPSDGALVGPFPILLAIPEVGQAFATTLAALSRASPLSPSVREVAILATGSVYKAAYELYAHSKLALAETSLTPDQVRLICEGEKPEGLSEGCEVAFEIGRFLAGKPGPLPKGMWERGEGVLGREGLVSVVHYVGVYAWTCVLLNAVDAPVPKEE